jgi:hypothetical protein
MNIRLSTIIYFNLKIHVGEIISDFLKTFLMTILFITEIFFFKLIISDEPENMDRNFN